MDRVVPVRHARGAACAALGLLCIACLAFPLLPAHAESVTWPPIGQWVGNAPYHVAAHGDYVTWIASSTSGLPSILRARTGNLADAPEVLLTTEAGAIYTPVASSELVAAGKGGELTGGPIALIAAQSE